MHSKIGEIYTTPWKSIIIKGINRSHRKGWDYVLGNYRINVRHAANELNWQVDDFDEEGLMLKRHIIRHFDKEDVRTYGLSFAVQTLETSNLFATIIIKKQPPKGANRLRSLDRFDIYHTRDFNANSSDIVLFRSDVAKEYLGPYLVSLCKLFYEMESAPATLTSDVPQASVATNSGTDEKQGKQLHQCKYCLTTYDDSLGDIENNVAPGTPFEALPESYQCPLCDAAKEDFIIIDESNLELIG